MNDGTSALPRLNTYPRSWIVPRIEAYVDGRPTPSSSSRLIKLASVNRAGGAVLWPLGSSSSAVRVSPAASSGSRRSRSSSSASGSSLPSTYARRNPGKVITLPVAANSASCPELAVPPSRTLTDCPIASDIWEATVRCQMSS